MHNHIRRALENTKKNRRFTAQAQLQGGLRLRYTPWRSIVVALFDLATKKMLIDRLFASAGLLHVSFSNLVPYVCLSIELFARLVVSLRLYPPALDIA